MIKSETLVKDCLDDLYQLGMIQGEHNINWADEYNLLEHSKQYYHKTKSIADKYHIDYNDSAEDYVKLMMKKNMPYGISWHSILMRLQKSIF